MEQYIWLLHRKKENGLIWAATGSFVVHGLMIALMASTQIFFPPTGENHRIDVVWLYSALLRDQPPESSPQEAPRSEAKETVPVQHAEEEEVLPAETHHEEPAVVAPVAPPKPEARPVPVPQPAARREPPVKVEAVRKAAPVKEELKLMEEGRGIPRPPPVANKSPEKAPASAKVSAAAATALKNITTATVAPAKVVRKETRKAVQAQAAEPQASKAAPVQVKRDVSIPRQTVAVAPREVAAPVATPRVVPAPRRESQQTAGVANPKEVRTPALPSQPVQPPARPAAPSLPKPAALAGSGTVARVETPPAANPTATVPKPSVAAAAQKIASPLPVPAKGIVEAPVTGDLKLELVGKSRSLKGAKITVLFRDYPRSRRGKTLAKAEALRRRQIHPKLVRPTENTLQAVVEVAAEGVYEFRVESESGGAVEAEYVARFYEKTGKAKRKSLGTRAVGNKERITRVLMPEGIVWEDDTAFSGSMEDSDSVTKFNSETGLVWKEYREE